MSSSSKENVAWIDAKREMDRMLSSYVVIFAIVSVFLMINLEKMGTPLRQPFSPDGIISFELAGTANRSVEILNAWNEVDLSPGEVLNTWGKNWKEKAPANPKGTHAARQSIKRDFWFILFYVLTIALACVYISRRFRNQLEEHKKLSNEDEKAKWLLSDWVCNKGRKAGIAFAILVVFAGILDVVENLALLSILKTYLKDPTSVPRGSLAFCGAAAAWIKFGILAITFLYLTIGVAMVSWKAGRDVIRRVILIRVPLLIGLGVQMLALLGLFGPATFRNAIVTNSFWGPAIIGGQVFLVMKMCEWIAGFIWKMAQARFGAPDPREVPAILKKISSYLETAKEDNSKSISILAKLYLFMFPLPLAVILRHEWDWVSNWFEQDVWWKNLIENIVIWARAFIMCIVGVVFAQTFFEIVEKESEKPLEESSGNKKSILKGILKRIGRTLSNWAGPGFVWEADDPEVKDGKYTAGTLRFEHVFLIFNFLGLAVIYLISAFVFNPRTASVDFLPPLAYLLGWMMLMLSVLSGMAFLLDRYRVPLLFGIILWGGFQFTIFKVDHTFELTRDGEAEAPITDSLVSRFDVASDLILNDKDDEEKKIVTLVCSAGGGIQAAAWTAMVLEGLSSDEHLKGSFPQSISLISSTSGGSVGAYHFLEAFDPKTGAFPRVGVGKDGVFEASFSSSLEEALWGLLYPDATRLLFPPAVPRRIDRAWSIERAWLRHTEDMLNEEISKEEKRSKEKLKPTRWSDWTARTRDGRLPAVVYNSTFVESGSQFFISTVDLYEEAQSDLRFPSNTLQQIYGANGDVDLDAVTAARLSATFPIITPASRAVFRRGDREKGHAPAWHAVDGGFYDNPGIVPAVIWIQKVLSDESIRNRIGKILVIQINGFPQERIRNRYDSLKFPGGRGEGVGTAALWPIQTLASVRVSSQTERGLLELDLLAKQYPGMIKNIEFRPGGYPADRQPPLSWQLGKNDREYLNRSWKMQLEESESDANKSAYWQVREIFGGSDP